MPEAGGETGGYLDSDAYRKAFRLALYTHEVIRGFPEEVRRSLVPDMVESAIAIPSNIAEGCRQPAKKGALGHLVIAYCRCGRLKSQLSLCKDLNYIGKKDYENVKALGEEVSRTLQKMIKGVNA
jgi:four helix bundle protein